MSKRSHEETREERREKKRKSRWQDSDNKSFVPGMPTQIPSNLTPAQEKMYIIQLQIEDLTRRLRTGDLGIPIKPEERSPSPEPVYDTSGKRLNTREYRTRKRMEEDRHDLIQRLMDLNPEYKPPGDYRAPMNRLTDKVWIPQDNHPNINFVGLLIGPRGNTLKALEKEVCSFLHNFNISKQTNAKIIIRGKGSVKEGKIGRLDGMPLPGEDEPLHAYVQAATPEALEFACGRIRQIIKEGVEVPEGENDLRRAQLRELALLNGTLRENEGLAKLRAISESQTIATNTIVCSHCGGAGHLDKDCRVNTASQGGTYYSLGAISQVIANPKEKAKMDSEYTALMAELGVNGMPKGSDPLPPGATSFKQPPPPGVAEDEAPPGTLSVGDTHFRPGTAPQIRPPVTNAGQPNTAVAGTNWQGSWPTGYYPPPPPGGGFSYPYQATGGESYNYYGQAGYFGGYWNSGADAPPGVAATAGNSGVSSGGYQLPPPPPPPPGL